MRVNDEYYRGIREGNAEAVGAALALVAVLIVGGFVFFSLRMTDVDATGTGSRLVSGYGVTQTQNLASSR